MRLVTGMMLASALGLAGCNEDKPAMGTPTADGASGSATMRTAAGAEVGRATVTEVAGGLRFTIDARGMPAGTHGLHVHTVGRCDPPGFESAGPHWNPTAAKHGTMNPQGPHQGDLPNLVIDSGGRGSASATVPGATMAALMDADGATMMVHATADDNVTDPSGNSGGRIACGVFAAN